MATTKKATKTSEPPARVAKLAAAASTELTAKAYEAKLRSYQSDAELKKIQRYFKSGAGDYGEGDTFIGVRMGQVFALSQAYIAMPVAEFEKLLLSDIHEVRAGACSLMDKQARSKKTPESQRKALYDLYFRRLDRINNWDLVDLAAPFVVGGYLHEFNKPRAVLYKLARSKNMWERRTAVLASYYFLRQGDTADMFKLADMLLKDDQDLIHKCVGAGLRWAGDSDPVTLRRFLDAHAATMPRVMLRFAIEHFKPAERKHYLDLKAD